MCRWLAYYGKPIRMDKVLYQGQYSLIDQSLKSRLGAEPTNGDGFGIGWYSPAGDPGVFHSTEPAWNDRNLREISGHVESHLFFAHVRATTGTPVQETNCHPFHYGKWLWMHNGLLGDWLTVKRDLVLQVALAGLGKTGGEHHRRPDFALDAGRNGIAHTRGRQRKHGEVDPWRQVLRAFEHRPAVDRLVATADEVDIARELVQLEGLQNDLAGTARTR